MDTYLIKLFPIDRFYFGNDVTFGPDNTNYFVRSVHFPQQTTLLGMLRYYLLQQNNLLDEKGKVNSTPTLVPENLIGNSGFDATPKLEFGIIKKLSPVFISGPDGEYFVQSREFGLQWQEDELNGDKRQELVPLKVRKGHGKNSFSEHDIHYFEGFNAKTEIPDLLVNARTGQMRFFEYKEELKDNPMNGIFIPNEQVGIRLQKKQQEKSANEKGFYKQIGYTLLTDYSFAFYAEMNVESDPKFDDGFVRMGADQSWFRLSKSTAKGTDQSILKNFTIDMKKKSLVNNLFNKVNDFDKKVVLLSDCYLTKDEYDNCPFASVSTVPFRFIKITTKEGKNTEEKRKIFSLKGAGLKLIKSEEYITLLKKGSVLYVNSKEEKEELIKNLTLNQAFYQIGYNYAI
ncbi:MAG: type III-B CRISPR module-associated Cmr3 family protein [Mariniphaga sp.]